MLPFSSQRERLQDALAGPLRHSRRGYLGFPRDLETPGPSGPIVTSVAASN